MLDNTRIDGLLESVIVCAILLVRGRRGVLARTLARCVRLRELRLHSLVLGREEDDLLPASAYRS
jgi:hypothetical protein